ncbi:MAG: DUF6754 domain-containing protein, partial [Planctomycetota bacterium]
MPMLKLSARSRYIYHFLLPILTIFTIYQKVYCIESSPTNNLFVELRVEDCPNDGGGAFCIIWKRFENETGENLYKIYWINDKNENILLDEFPDTEKLKSGLRMFYGKFPNDIRYHGVFIKNLPDVTVKKEGTKAKFFVEYVSKSGTTIARSNVFEVTTKINWFKSTRLYVLAFLIIFAIILFFFIVKGKKGKFIFIRKISGLDAIDDAIGRATEMGRPILYCAGLAPVSGLSTIASLSILSQVIKKIAQYGTRI